MTKPATSRVSAAAAPSRSARTAGQTGRGGAIGGAPQAVRLIGGQWRRHRLPVADRPGLRPTPDRVRETLFNWLGQQLDGWRCLDAFAGSGALGLEAASRGAAQVLLVERDPALARALSATVTALGAAPQVTVEPGDGLQVLRRQAPGAWDLVFLDPPWGSDLLAPALEAVASIVAPGGFVYAEDAAPLASWPAGLALWRSTRAGAVHAHLLRRAVTAELPAS